VGKHGHPEWFSNRVITVGKSADLGNVDCVAFFQKYLLNFFKESGVHTWRSDFEPICYSSNKKNRHDANGTDVQYWCTVGFLEVVDYLYENLDYFRYESCSSGGSMKDLLTATRAVVINCDDSADFHSLKMSFYDSSYVIHPTQLQLPTNCLTYVHTSKYYSGVGDYVYGLRSQLVGGVMLCNWEGGRDIETAYWLKYLKAYNARIKPLIRYGDLYHIFDRPDGIHWDGMAYIDADAESSTKGIVMLWKPTEQDGDTKTIKLRGLDASATYEVKFNDRTEQNVTMTGKELMEKGFEAKIEGKSGSEWVWIVEK
jgi:alpha-galactosidase